MTKVYCYTPTEAPDEFILINDDILVSTDHVLYINNWWVRAEDAQVGDKLLSYIDSGPQMITINATESEYHNVSCYALELESSLGALASYFADGILVCE